MEKLTLEVSVNIPVQQYAPIRVSVGIELEKEKTSNGISEITDEELFIRAHKQLTNLLEAEVALRTSEFLKIIKEGGLLLWAKALTDELTTNENKFINAYKTKEQR